MASIITLCNDIQKLEEYISLAETELKERVESWGITGTDMIDIINNLPF